MREYQGIGEVTIPNIGIIKGEFSLKFESSGKPILYLKTEMAKEKIFQLLAMPFGPFKFSGSSNYPYYMVEIEKIYKKSVNSQGEFSFHIFHDVKITYKELDEDQEVELRFGISNLLFYGTEGITEGSNWRLGKISWRINGKDISLEQLPDFEKIKEVLIEEKSVCITSELKTKCKPEDMEESTQICKNLQGLFSIATGNYVTALYQDIYCDGKLCRTVLLPRKTYTYSNWPYLIDSSVQDRYEFRDFINITYQNYVDLKDNLGLSYFVEFFTTSKIYSPLEVEYLLSTTAFECLEGYFRRWKSLSRISFKEGGLKEKIRRMCRNFSFSVTESELETYPSCRNSIAHEGKFPATVDKVISLMELRNLMDRFILTILGYRNKPYYNVVKRDKDMVP